MANNTKMGQIFKSYPPVTIPSVPLAASVAFKNLGGKFMTKDGSGNYALSVATDSQIAGWADVGEFTSSASAAAQTAPLIVDLGAIFEIPVDAAITDASLIALIGLTCDLVVNAGIQQAAIGTSTYDVVKIVGGSVANQTVYVQINPAKFYTAGVV